MPVRLAPVLENRHRYNLTISSQLADKFYRRAAVGNCLIVFELGLGRRAARYDRFDGNFFERQLLGLKVRPAAIEHGDCHENSARHQHQDGKEKKVLLVVHLHTAIGVTDEVVHTRGKKVAHRDGEEPQRHDRAFHFIRRLRVGKFETRNRDHRFAQSENDVSEELPVHAWSSTGIDHLLDVPNDEIAAGSEKKANANLAKRRQRKEPINEWIDDVVHEWDEQENQDWIGRLHLRGK